MAKENKSNTTTLAPWHQSERLDVSEVNSRPDGIFSGHGFIDEYPNTISILAKDLALKFNPDVRAIMATARVHKVLSGPQANNQASTREGRLTNQIDVEGMPAIGEAHREESAGEPIIRVLALPSGLDGAWMTPAETSFDQLRISMCYEFVGYKDEFKMIIPGAEITIRYFNDEQAGQNGQAVGEIVSLDRLPSGKLLTKTSPTRSLTPICKAASNLSGPADSSYSGHTESNPNSNPGPLIRKLKSTIKTGMYGNGTPQTKAHFDESLRKATVSPKYKIPGPAPDSNNSFIWIGNLKNNGRMDVMNRPTTPGRETIIYAPMTLDLSSPIEIKYYFHDSDGFGRAWIPGRGTLTADSIETAGDSPNDFREKIAPAIKDLIKDGRNIILVIPEMAHSRGFGSTLYSKESIRTAIPPSLRDKIKDDLRKIEIDTAQTALRVNPLIEREFSTFDGSYSGGDFKLFHNEVLEVLEEHFGNLWDKIDFISILAEGVGAVSLSAMVKKISTSSVHSKAEINFRDVKVKRIDFIDTGVDENNSYNYYFPRTPSYSLYEDYLLIKASSPDYLEFNYMTSPTTKKVNSFFNALGYNDEYAKNNVPTNELGEKKFTLSIGAGPESKNTINLHMGRRRDLTGYAFSLLNRPSEKLENYPLKGDSRTQDKPSHDSVPDHAAAATVGPTVLELQKHLRQIELLEKKLQYFENLLSTIKNYGNLDSLCFVQEYSLFCDGKTVRTDENSPFFKQYIQYLEDKKQLIFHHEMAGIQANLETAEKYQLLQEARLFYKQKLDEDIFATDFDENEGVLVWDQLNASFVPAYFTQPGSLMLGEDLKSGAIASAARDVVMKDVYQNTINAIDRGLKNLDPEPIGQQPSDCPPTPKRLREVVSEVSGVPAEAFMTPDRVESYSDCFGLSTMPTPSTYTELLKLIPYYARKQDFQFSKGKTNSTSKTNLDTKVPSFKISDFSYISRGPGDKPTSRKSKKIWSCLSDKLEGSWVHACNVSRYTPFRITAGIRGYKNARGTTAYRSGLSSYALGLGINVDPHIAGYSRGKTKKKNGKLVRLDQKPVFSIWTGAWTPGFIDRYLYDLQELGVFPPNTVFPIENLLTNAYESVERKTPRRSKKWKGAHDSYYRSKAGEPCAGDKGVSIMRKLGNSIIVPDGANPTLWLLTFCESSGMFWGNGLFMKRDWSGRQFSNSQISEINRIYREGLGVDNIFQRINNISWQSSTEDHMLFQYWKGSSLILWGEIEKGIENSIQ